MIDKVVQKLLREGKLRRQQAGISQVEALLKQAMLDLAEAKKIVAIADRATYVLAYMAMLKAGRALLLHKGYTPDDGAQHRTVVEVTSVILGERYRVLTRHFEVMRRKRNEMTYEAGALVSSAEAQRAFADAADLVKRILNEVKRDDSQLELKFKIE